MLAFCSFENVDVLLLANLFQDFRPHADGNLAKMRLPQERHQRARLLNPAPNAEGDFVLDDGLMVREFQEIGLFGELQLFT